MGDARDRAFVTHLVQGVWRWRLRLDWIIEQHSDLPLKKVHPRVLAILRLALYQIFFMDRVPDSAAVNEAAIQTKQRGLHHAVPFINGVLRTICRRKDHIPYPDRKKDPLGFLSVFYSYPPWLVKLWIGQWGEAFTEELLVAGNRLPTLTVRTNTLKTDRDRLLALLGRKGIAAAPAPHAPEGILLPGFRGSVSELAAFKEGLFQVQDQAAQIASHLLQPGPGEWVLDLCAGRGGKSTHLAECMKDRGRVVSVDIHRWRLRELRRTARRLGIRSVLPLAADAAGPIRALFRRDFDAVLVDAPCSGLGVLSRHPDGKWNRRREDLPRLAQDQLALLLKGAKLLKPGGRMLYVTCTLSEEENDGVVAAFLERQKDFDPVDLRTSGPSWAGALLDEKGFYRTYPHKHAMDGFFGALLKKRGP